MTTREFADRRRSERRRKLATLRHQTTLMMAVDASDLASRHIRGKCAARRRRVCKMLGKGLD